MENTATGALLEFARKAHFKALDAGA